MQVELVNSTKVLLINNYLGIFTLDFSNASNKCAFAGGDGLICLSNINISDPNNK